MADRHRQEVLYATDTLAAGVSESARFFKQTLSNTVSNDEREKSRFSFLSFMPDILQHYDAEIKTLKQYNMIMAVLLTMRTKNIFSFSFIVINKSNM